MGKLNGVSLTMIFTLFVPLIGLLGVRLAWGVIETGGAIPIGGFIGIIGGIVLASGLAFVFITRKFPDWSERWTTGSIGVALGAVFIGASCTSGACLPSIAFGTLLNSIPLIPIMLGATLGTWIGKRTRGPS